MLQIGTRSGNEEIVRGVGWADWFLTALIGVMVAGGGFPPLFAGPGVAQIDQAASLVNEIDDMHWLATTAIGAGITVAVLTLTTLRLLDLLETKSLDSRVLFHLGAVILGAFAAQWARLQTLVGFWSRMSRK